MKEIGGYIEFEKNTGEIYHNNAIALNCGRNCLAYLIRSKKINKIKIPDFLCDSVKNLCDREHVQVTYYPIGIDLKPPDMNLDDNEWLYVVNYYAQLDQPFLSWLKLKYDRLIVDNAQNYFQMPIKGTDTLYTCRKFFGVSDGAFLYTDSVMELEERDLSYDRMHYLMGRFEKEASEFYPEYIANNNLFEEEEIKKISKLTLNILRGINYKRIRDIRTANFSYLHDILKKKNKLDLIVPDGAFMYPLYIEKGNFVRANLLQDRIYIPTLWPEVFERCRENEIAYDMAQNILPLPVDQRYDVQTMEYIANKIMEMLENE